MLTNRGDPVGWFLSQGTAHAPRWRRAGIVGLILFGLGDVFLAVHALRHTNQAPRSVVSLDAGSPAVSSLPTPLPTPSVVDVPSAFALTIAASPTAAVSFGSCKRGHVSVAGNTVAGLTRVVAVTGTSGDAALIGEDNKCKAALWRYGAKGWTVDTKVTLPVGPAAVSSSAYWVIGSQAGVVVDPAGKVLTRPTNPCKSSPRKESGLVAWSATQATLFCTEKATKAGQIRLVYGTTDGGKTWAEFGGARALGANAKGRKDGLDGDGQLRGVGSLGKRGALGALLSNSGCNGLQLRTSTDSGRNWKAAGCLLSVLKAVPLALGGTQERTVVVGLDGTAPVTYVSTDRGVRWGMA
jgi:hypothetical protein